MNIDIHKLKKDIDIDIEDNFYKDIIYWDLSLVYYAEKSAKIFYKILKEKELEKCEKEHTQLLKEIIKNNLITIDKWFYEFVKSFVKDKNEEKIRSVLNSGEYYSIMRYKTLIYYIKDKKVLDILNKVLEDELYHFYITDENKIEYKNNFLGYDNFYVYNKYKNKLNIDYNTFKNIMINSNFCKRLRGEIQYD